MLYHTTRTGDRVAIAQMSDSHLFNTVRLIIRRLNEARIILENPQECSTVAKVLYGNASKQMKDQARDTIKSLYEILPHYVLELELRSGVPDSIRSSLQEAIGRNQALPGGLPSNEPAQPEGLVAI
jgi:hypothetical protein